MTPRQRALARHALGLPNNLRPVPHRGRVYLGPGARDYGDWAAMVESGEADVNQERHCFQITRAGAELALNPGEKLDSEDFPEVPNA